MIKTKTVIFIAI